MIVATAVGVIKTIGKIYHDVHISLDGISQPSVSLKVIREASKEEYDKDCISRGITPYSVKGQRFWEVSID